MLRVSATERAGGPLRTRPRLLRARCRATGAVAAEAKPWADVFTPLDDRKDLPPLELPAIKKPMRVVLVRHGESTWNAENRLQGSSDEAVLTDKGKLQANMTKDVLASCQLDQLFFSPLRRASETADIIWADRPGAKKLSLPSLREIDLYEFQGLAKDEGKAKYGEQYVTWQTQPANFELNGRFPVRELWHRASIAWKSILSESSGPTCLVVAHNAVNQALLCSAAGLPPSAFRKFTQGNGAVSVLDFAPAPLKGRSAEVTIDRVNQLPSLQVKKSDAKNATVLLVCAPEKGASGESRAFGVTLGREVAQALQATGGVLSGVRTSKPSGAKAVANEILAAAAARQGTRTAAVQVISDLSSALAGDGEGASAPLSVLRRTAPQEAVDLVWQQSGPVWESIKKEAMLAAATGEGDVSVVVADPLQLAFLLCKAAGLSRDAVWKLRFTPGGCTLLEVGQSGAAIVRCVNSLSHRTGQDASPITAAAATAFGGAPWS